MPEQRVVNVTYPRKKREINFKPFIIAIITLLVIVAIWFIFFRGSSNVEETTQETEKQEEATTSAKPASPSAKNLDTKIDTSDWYEYKDVEETFTILVPKGWFFDKGVKGSREVGKILGGVGNYNFDEKKFDPDKNFMVYFERDSLQSDLSIETYAARIACTLINGDNCENPDTPETQKTLVVADKVSVWQEIHKEDEGIGIEVYIPLTETEIFVLYSLGKVPEIDGDYKVESEFEQIIEGMLSTLKFL